MIWFQAFLPLVFSGASRLNQDAVSEVTRILQSIENGEARAAEKWLPLVDEELRRLAAQRDWAYARAWLFQEIERWR